MNSTSARGTGSSASPRIKGSSGEKIPANLLKGNCGLLKYHKIGIFIGTETGGTYECNDARKMFELRNTRLRLFVARMTFTAAVKDLARFRGIIPDIAVEPNISDYLSGLDPVRERALSLQNTSF